MRKSSERAYGGLAAGLCAMFSRAIFVENFARDVHELET